MVYPTYIYPTGMCYFLWLFSVEQELNIERHTAADTDREREYDVYIYGTLYFKYIVLYYILIVLLHNIEQGT